jgi:hypothetical protein
VFSTILGLGTSLLGMRSASRQNNANYKMFTEQLRQQGAEREQNLGFAADARDAMAQRNDELRAWEEWVRNQALQERDFAFREADRYTEMLLSERRQEIDRQVRMDQEAARIQAFRLEQALQNQRLSAEERAFAIQELQEAQMIASEERTEDLRRFYENDARTQLQRDFMMGVFQDAQSTAREEQRLDLDQRDALLGRIDRLTGTVQAAYDSMGQAPTVERLTAGDIDREISRRTDQYVGDVDRAAERVASINEANLIRTGMDRSTPGTQARGEVAARLADEYQTARMRAYDDALKYITGRSGALAGNVNDIMANRGAILGEVSGVAGTGMRELATLPQVRSRLSGNEFARLVGDGVYDRSIMSANNYNAPVAVGSGIYEADMRPGLSDFRLGTSAAINRAAGLPTAITNPATLRLESPEGYLASAGANSVNQLNNASNMYASSSARLGEASSGFFRSLGQFGDDRGWLSGLFGGSQ